MHACFNTRGFSGQHPLGGAAIAGLFVLGLLYPRGAHGNDHLEQQFIERIQPILEDRCFGCHGNG